MMRSTRTGIACALALTLAGCATNGAGGQEVEGLLGCYQIERDAGARTLGLPWGFVLTEAPLEGYANLPDAREAETAVGPVERAAGPFMMWRFTQADSIHVGAAPGGGFSLRLAREGRDLVGSARAVGDAMAFGERADDPARGPVPVVARQVLCGAT